MTSPTIDFDVGRYRVSLARSASDLRAAQRLRYDVFIAELGADGDGVDHAQRVETDPFDDVSDHLLLWDRASGRVVGTYRVMRAAQAQSGTGFYSQSEYDVTPLLASGRELLELGRSCVDTAHRGGAAMFHLWTGLARYVSLYGSEVLFGVASLKGTDPVALSAPLSLLHHRHRAPTGLRPRARVYQPMDLIAEEALDRRAAMIAMPSLIKSYLRLGGQVGDGAYIDREFNCIDVCMVIDAAQVRSEMGRRLTESAA